MADDPDALTGDEVIPPKLAPNIGFIADGQPYEPPLSASLRAYDQTAPPFGEAFMANVTQSSPLAWLGRAQERGTQAGASAFDRGLFTAGESGRAALEAEAGVVPNALGQPVQSEMLTADEANKRYAPEGSKITDGPIPDGLARIIGRQKAEELRRNSIIARSAEANAWPVNFGSGMAAFMLDPLNLATNFVPGFGEAATAAAVGRIGMSGLAARMVTRGVAGATAMTAQQVPLSLMEFGLGREEASDFGIRDALTQVFYGAVLGAAFHAGFGGLREAGLLRPDHIMRPPELEPPPAVGRGSPQPTGPADHAAGEALGGVQADVETGRAHEAEAGAGGVQPAPTPADAATVSLAAHAHADAMKAAIAEVLDERPVDVTPVLQVARPPAVGAPTPHEVAAHQQDLAREGHVTGIPSGDLRETTEAIYQPGDVSLRRDTSGRAAEPGGGGDVRPSAGGEPETPAAPTRPADYGANNKLVTREDAAAIIARLRAKASQLNTGIDPVLMLDGARLAVFHIEAGSRAFAEFGRQMLADIGQEARPYLRSWYEAARHWPGLDAGGMSSAAEIEAGVEVPSQRVTAPPAAGPRLVSTEEADGPRLVSTEEADALRGRLRAKTAGLRADPEMEAAERQLAEIMPHLSDEERAEIEATAARVTEADQHAAAYQEAAVCLRAA